MTAERVNETRSAPTKPQPRSIFHLKQLFRESKACLAHALQPKRKKRGGETRSAFARAALHLGTLAGAMFFHHISPAFDEGLSIHLWHENNHQDDMAENNLGARAAQNYLSPHL